MGQVLSTAQEQGVSQAVDGLLKTPTKGLLVGIAFTLLAQTVNYYRSLSPDQWSAKLVKVLKLSSSVRKQISDEKASTAVTLRNMMVKRQEGEYVIKGMPEKGFSAAEVLERAKVIKSYNNAEWLTDKDSEGKAGLVKLTSAACWHNEKETKDLAMDVFKLYNGCNALHPDLFPGVRKMEAEVIAMGVSIYNGGPDACGSITSGGTESILLAMYSYKNWAKDVKGITKPNFVMPLTAHAAFDKAATYFGIELRAAPFNEQTGKVDPKDIERLMDWNTICIVGSCPNYPNGAVDNIPALAKIAKARNVGLHVDACLGGFLVPFLKDAGYPLEFDFDFSVDGVTSISADSHKYGCAVTGSSLVMYSNQALRRYQFFAQPRWPGGIYSTPTIAGARSGSIIASTWSTFMVQGRSGYTEAARDIIRSTRRLVAGLGSIPGIYIIGQNSQPETSVTCLASDDFSVYTLSDRLKACGWRWASMQFPTCIHYVMTRIGCQDEMIDAMIEDVRRISAELKVLGKDAKEEGAAAVYCSAQKVPRAIVSELGNLFYDIYYTAQFPDEKTDSEGRIMSNK